MLDRGGLEHLLVPDYPVVGNRLRAAPGHGQLAEPLGHIARVKASGARYVTRTLRQGPGHWTGSHGRQDRRQTALYGVAHTQKLGLGDAQTDIRPHLGGVDALAGHKQVELLLPLQLAPRADHAHDGPQQKRGGGGGGQEQTRILGDQPAESLSFEREVAESP